MSLKAFHILFIAVSAILALGFGLWAFSEYRKSGDIMLLIAGLGAFGGAAGLVVYGRWFLRKLNGVNGW